MNPNSSDEIVGERGAIGAESPKKGKGMAGKGAVVAVMLAGCSYLAWSAVSPSGQPEEEAPKKFVVEQTSDLNLHRLLKLNQSPLVPEVALPTPGATPVKKVEDDPLLQSAQRAPVIAFSKESSRRGEARGGGERASPFVPVNEEPDRDAQKFQNLMKPTVLQVPGRGASAIVTLSSRWAHRFHVFWKPRSPAISPGSRAASSTGIFFPIMAASF